MKKSLTEILETEKIILIDTSTIGGKEELVWQIYKSSSPNNIRALELIKEKNMLEQMRNYFTSYYNKIITVSDVANEFNLYLECIQEKLEFFSSMKKISKKHQKNDETSKFDQETNTRLLQEINEIAYDIYGILKKRIASANFEIDPKELNFYSESIIEISKKMDLKKKNILPNHKISRKPKADMRTDEKICAVQCYFSNHLKLETALISSDSDFIKLMTDANSLIGAMNFSPYNDKFRENLATYPAKLYLKPKGDFSATETLSTGEIMFKKEFIMPDVPKIENEKVKSSIKTGWEELYFSGALVKTRK
jgi:hypothetical protein